MSPTRNICQNLVFRISWTKNNISDIKFELIGMKVILFDQAQNSWGNKNWMYPKYNDHDEIDGVCWITTGEFHNKAKKTDIFYELPNLQDSDY